MARFITDAPRSYDYGYTEEIKVIGTANNGSEPRDVRLVDISDPHGAGEYQIPRYRSGLYVAVPEGEWEDSGLQGPLHFEPLEETDHD